jgi:translin
VDKAKKLYLQYKKKSSSNLSRYLITPGQELVEAYVFLAIIKKEQIPSVKTLGVSGESYVLGLLDCIGELKRLVYDDIRIGNSSEALRVFDIMEKLYLELGPFAVYDKIIKESRRKLDVARILLEDTRAAITEEIRRNELIKAINKAKK